jgi:hypothetical protein
MTTLFTGYYNRVFAQDNPINGYTSIPGWLDKYPNALTLVQVDSQRLLSVITSPTTPLFYELYTWATYTDNTFTTKLGEITYNCYYPDTGTGVTSAPSIQAMTVLGADGIYAGVNKVVMNFTTPPIRTIQFIYA